MIRAKICGLTRLEDALLAESLGAWAVGFILVSGTKRYIEAEHIRPISQALGPFISKVGVFVDSSPDETLEQMATAKLQVVQLHGSEPPEWAQAIRLRYPVIKVIKLSGPADPAWLSYPADALMVDAVTGGSGQSYPLEWVKPLLSHPRLIIAGGLNPDNLDHLDRTLALKPYAVDVSSGVEAQLRVKDPDKLKRFLQRVQASAQ